MSHNQKLNALLKSVRGAKANSNTQDDAARIVTQLRALGGPIRYEDSGKLGLGLFLLGIGAYGHILGSERGYPIGPDGTSGSSVLIYNVAIALAACFILFWFFRRRKAQKFVQEVYENAALASYGLNDEPIPKLKDWDRNFHEFNRGNHSREIMYCRSAAGRGESGREAYSLFRFHWVVCEERQVTETDHNGHSTSKTETTYYHYDRYGVLVEGNFSGIQISSDAPNSKYKLQYRPASVAFNRLYKLRCVEEMQTAKFLKPSIVIALEAAVTQLKNPNLEFGLNGQICLTWESDPFNVRTVMRSKDRAEELAKIIEDGAKMPILDVALELVALIQRHTQSNFSALNNDNTWESNQGVK
ncbi:MAG: hypothetical protein P1U47_02880 [Zhongshania sp.]|uniref:hypothetical protein n=1 Tax=Zhongshania sp. TaxID=1971902 RepID=UPI00261350C5|nr:hypothetical protein [Zhongshania sp.]MDF1691291.1 hypothetical protein [Zhongshania sp.]